MNFDNYFDAIAPHRVRRCDPGVTMSSGEEELIRDGWFTERCVLWPGQAMRLEVKTVLHRERSAFQDILIFESTTYGRVLALDGVIQVTERDEHAYHEMLTHLPMCSHPDPRSVCIVGGGDGGIVREVLRHPNVERVVLCELDKRVVELSREYLPKLSHALDDARVHFEYRDGAQYLVESPNKFDVIITDSSDPVGPAETLFEPDYHRKIAYALKPGGIMASQGECLWLHLDLIGTYLQGCRKVFAVAEYAYTTIPTYPSGQIGTIIASKSDSSNLTKPLRQLPATEVKRLRYYNRNIHSASFVLPEFARRALANISPSSP